MLALVLIGNLLRIKRAALREPDVPQGLRDRGAGRLCRCARRLGRDRGRRQPWTVYGLMRTSETSVAVTHRHRRAAVLHRIYRRLPDHLPRRPHHHGAHCPPRSRCDRPGRPCGKRPTRHAHAGLAGRAPGRRCIMSAFTLDLVPIWTVILGVRGFPLRPARRLRSRRRISTALPAIRLANLVMKNGRRGSGMELNLADPRWR